MTVQLTLDQMERPLRDRWATLYAQAANSATDYWGRRYYNDDQGFCSLVQWAPTSVAAKEGREFGLSGVRRTEPYGFGRKETVEQWFARLDASVGQPGSYVGAWLLPLTQLAELAGQEPIT
jgi:hypothetical protein